MKTTPNIIINQIRTPDGTLLRSMHVHDYVTYTDKNGREYMVDGGSEYLRRNVHKSTGLWFRFTSFLLSLIKIKRRDPLTYEELSIYSNDRFEVIRENLHRGGRGKDGLQPLTWVPMDKMSDSWLEACITYNEERGMGNSFSSKMYTKELKYRKRHGISITD